MHSATNSFSREISQHFDSYFKQYNLATSYVELLLLIREKGEISQKEMSDKMNLAPSTITRFIQKLEKKGFIKKNKSGRIVMIRLTAKAEQLSENLKISYENAVTDLEAKLGEKFVNTTEQLLKHGTDLIKQK